MTSSILRHCAGALVVLAALAAASRPQLVLPASLGVEGLVAPDDGPVGPRRASSSPPEAAVSALVQEAMNIEPYAVSFRSSVAPFDAWEFTARIVTRAQSGTIVSKVAPGGLRRAGEGAGQPKVLFLQDGQVCFDVLSKGTLRGTKKVNDGRPHQVGVRWTGELFQIVVDGRIDEHGQGLWKAKQVDDDAETVLTVGNAVNDLATGDQPAGEFSPLFSGWISNLKYSGKPVDVKDYPSPVQMLEIAAKGVAMPREFVNLGMTVGSLFVLTARIRTSAASGSIFGKQVPDAQWRSKTGTSAGKLLCLRNGYVAFDVDNVGTCEGRTKVNDDQEHEVGVRYEDGMCTILVDGNPDGEPLRLKTYAPDGILADFIAGGRVGNGRKIIAPDFKGKISYIAYNGQSVAVQLPGATTTSASSTSTTASTTTESTTTSSSAASVESTIQKRPRPQRVPNPVGITAENTTASTSAASVEVTVKHHHHAESTSTSTGAGETTAATSTTSTTTTSMETTTTSTTTASTTSVETTTTTTPTTTTTTTSVETTTTPSTTTTIATSVETTTTTAAETTTSSTSASTTTESTTVSSTSATQASTSATQVTNVETITTTSLETTMTTVATETTISSTSASNTAESTTASSTLAALATTSTLATEATTTSTSVATVETTSTSATLAESSSTSTSTASETTTTSTAITASAAVASQASVPEVAGEQAQLDSIRALFAATNRVVCGGDEIHRLLVEGQARTLPWSSIYAVVKEYVKNQGMHMERLKHEIHQLQDAIPVAEAAETPKPMTEDQMRVLINSAVTAPGSFGSAEAARSTRCGRLAAVTSDSRKIKGNQAYKAAVAAFGGVANSLLDSGLVRSSGSDFFSFCKRVLVEGAADTPGVNGTSCGELCQAFADATQKISDQKAGAHAVTSKHSTKLREEVETKQATLKAEQAKVDDCLVANNTIFAFEQRMSGLEANIKKEHEGFRKARDNLNDEMYRLDDLLIDAGNHNKTLQELALALEGKIAEEKTIRNQLLDAEKNISDAAAAAQDAQKTLQQVQTKVNNTEAAVVVAGSLKSALSSALKEMHLYFKAGVRTPLAKLGLGPDTDVSKVFRQAADLPEAAATRKSLEALSALCNDQSTRRAFAALNSTDIRAESLCAFGDVQQVAQELDTAVQSKIDKIVKDLEEAQSWQDPYRGQNNMSEAQAAALVSKGEPRWLREAMAGFSKTSFYRNYLTHWKVKEKFHSLYDMLHKVRKAAGEAQMEARKSMLLLNMQLDQAKAQQRAVTAALNAALDANKAAASEKTQAQVRLDALAEQQRRLTDHIRELELVAEAARKRYEEAKKIMEDSHRKGVGLLQLIQDIGEGNPGSA